MKFFSTPTVKPLAAAEPQDSDFTLAEDLSAAQRARASAERRLRDIRVWKAVSPSADVLEEEAGVLAQLPDLRSAEQQAFQNFRNYADQRVAAAALKASERHRSAVREIARQLAKLVAACEAELAEREALAGAGVVNIHAPAMGFEPARTLDRLSCCSAAVWMQTARRLGYLAEDEDPATMRPSPK